MSNMSHKEIPPRFFVSPLMISVCNNTAFLDGLHGRSHTETAYTETACVSHALNSIYSTSACKMSIPVIKFVATLFVIARAKGHNSIQ